MKKINLIFVLGILLIGLGSFISASDSDCLSEVLSDSSTRLIATVNDDSTKIDFYLNMQGLSCDKLDVVELIEDFDLDEIGLNLDYTKIMFNVSDLLEDFDFNVSYREDVDYMQFSNVTVYNNMIDLIYNDQPAMGLGIRGVINNLFDWAFDNDYLENSDGEAYTIEEINNNASIMDEILKQYTDGMPEMFGNAYLSKQGNNYVLAYDQGFNDLKDEQPDWLDRVVEVLESGNESFKKNINEYMEEKFSWADSIPYLSDGGDLEIEVMIGNLSITTTELGTRKISAGNYVIPVKFTFDNTSTYTKEMTLILTGDIIIEEESETDYLAEAFDEISEKLDKEGIENNLWKVNSSNVNSFSGLYFEKLSGDEETRLGRIIFNSPLDLTKNETQNFLQNLGTRMDANKAGTIGLNFSGVTSDVSLKGVSATIKFYGLDKLGFLDNSTSEEVNSYLEAYDDDGKKIDKSESISANGTYVGACGVEPSECHMFTIEVNHFSKYKIKDRGLEADEQKADEQNVTVEENTTTLIFDNSSTVVEKIVIPQTILSNQTITLDMSYLAVNNITDNTSSVTVPNQIVLERDTSSTIDYEVTIPASTMITGTGWDGVLDLPTVTSLTTDLGSVETVVEIGDSNIKLTFNQAVKVVLTGMTGKKALWSDSTGTYSISSCDSTANSTSSGTLTTGECYLDDGSDLIIWTYHFTKFGAYTPTTTTSTGGSHRTTSTVRKVSIATDSGTNSNPSLPSGNINLNTNPNSNNGIGITGGIIGALTSPLFWAAIDITVILGIVLVFLSRKKKREAREIAKRVSSQLKEKEALAAGQKIFEEIELASEKEQKSEEKKPKKKKNSKKKKSKKKETKKKE